MNLRDIIEEKIVEILVESKLSEGKAAVRPSLSTDADQEEHGHGEGYNKNLNPAKPVPGKSRGRWYGKRVERLLAIKAKRGQKVDDED